MSPLDTGFPRDPEHKKRMLPSVTDVVRDLAKTVSADPAVLFKAARSVVAEELAKVKQGFEAAPLDVLVRRARLQLERDGAGIPVSEPAPPPMPLFPPRRAPARETSGPPPPSAKPAAADDPFQDLASRADLNWEKDLPIQPEDAPFRSAILPIPRRSRGPLEIAAPIGTVKDKAPAHAPAPTPLAYAPESEAPAQSEPTPLPETRPGPSGDLFEERPTEALKTLPRPTGASAPSIPLAHPREPEPSEKPAEPLPAPAAAGFERFLRAPSAPFVPAAPPAIREADEPHEPAAKTIPEMPPVREPIEDNTQPAMEEFHFKAPDPLPSAPPRSGGRGWLVAIALVLAVGAGLAWAVREYVFKNDVVKNAAPIARKKADETPAAVPAPVVAPPPAPAVVTKPAAPSAKPATPLAKPAPALPKGKAALLMTPDWAGKPAVYVIHFSSTKDRASAAKEAQKLGAALGTTARAVEVDLGEKGVWYRVVVGEFPDVDAARAFRADLEAKKTPGMGFVYEMRGR
jgi:SPOR domain